MGTFGQNLKSARVGRGMSLEEMGRLLGTTKQVLSRYENGHREPTITTAARYAGLLGVDVCDLIGGPPPVFSPSVRVVVSGDGKEKIYHIDSGAADRLCGLLDRLGNVEK